MADPQFTVVIPVNTPVVTDASEEVSPQFLTSSRMAINSMLGLKSSWQKQRHDYNFLSVINVPSLSIPDHAISGINNMEVLNEEGKLELLNRTANSQLPPSFPFSMGVQPTVLDTVSYSQELSMGTKYLSMTKTIKSVTPADPLYALPGWAKPGDTPLSYEIVTDMTPSRLGTYPLPSPLAKLMLEAQESHSTKVNPSTGESMTSSTVCALIYEEANIMCTGRILSCSPEITVEDMSRGDQDLNDFKDALNMRHDRTFFFQIPALHDTLVVDFLEKEIQGWLWPLIDRSYSEVRREHILEAIKEVKAERQKEMDDRVLERTARQNGMNADEKNYDDKVHGLFTEEDQRAWVERPIHISFGNLTTLMDLAGEELRELEVRSRAVLKYDQLTEVEQLDRGGYLVAVEFSHFRFSSPFRSEGRGDDISDDLSHMVPARIFIKRASDFDFGGVAAAAFNYARWNGKPPAIAARHLEVALKLSKSSLVDFIPDQTPPIPLELNFPQVSEWFSAPFIEPTLNLGPLNVPINEDTPSQRLFDYPRSINTPYDPRAPLRFAREWEAIVKVFCKRNSISEKESSDFAKLVLVLICWDLYAKPTSRHQQSIILEIDHGLRDILGLSLHFNGNPMAAVFYETSLGREEAELIHRIIMGVLKATIDPKMHDFPSPDLLNTKFTNFVKARQYAKTFEPVKPLLVQFEELSRHSALASAFEGVDAPMPEFAEGTMTLGDHIDSLLNQDWMIHNTSYNLLSVALTAAFHPVISGDCLLSAPCNLINGDDASKEIFVSKIVSVLAGVAAFFRDLVLGEHFELLDNPAALVFQCRTLTISISVDLNVINTLCVDEWRVVATAAATDRLVNRFLMDIENPKDLKTLLLEHAHLRDLATRYWDHLEDLGAGYSTTRTAAFAVPVTFPNIAHGFAKPELPLIMNNAIDFRDNSPWIPTELHAKVASWMAVDFTKNETLGPPFEATENLVGHNAVASEAIRLSVAIDIRLDASPNQFIHETGNKIITEQVWAHSVEGTTTTGRQCSGSLFLAVVVAKLVYDVRYFGWDTYAGNIVEDAWIYAVSVMGNNAPVDSIPPLDDSTFLPFGLYFRELRDPASFQLRNLLTLCAFLGVNPHLVCPHPKKRHLYTIIPLLPSGTRFAFMASVNDLGCKWRYLSADKEGVISLFTLAQFDRKLTVWQYPNYSPDPGQDDLLVGGHSALTYAGGVAVNAGDYGRFKARKDYAAVAFTEGVNEWKIYNLYLRSEAPDFHNYWWKSAPPAGRSGPMTLDEVTPHLTNASIVSAVGVAETRADVESLVETEEALANGLRLSGPQWLARMAAVVLKIDQPLVDHRYAVGNFLGQITNHLTFDALLGELATSLDYLYKITNAAILPPGRARLTGADTVGIIKATIRHGRTLFYIQKLVDRNEIKTALTFTAAIVHATVFSMAPNNYLGEMHKNYNALFDVDWTGFVLGSGVILGDNYEFLEWMISFLDRLTDDADYMTVMDGDEARMMVAIMSFCTPFMRDVHNDMLEKLWDKIREAAGYLQLPFEVGRLPRTAAPTTRNTANAKKSPVTALMWPMAMLMLLVNKIKLAVRVAPDTLFASWKAELAPKLFYPDNPSSEAVLTTALLWSYTNLSRGHSPRVRNEFDNADNDAGFGSLGIRIFFRLLYDIGGAPFETNNSRRARIMPLVGAKMIPLVGALYSQMLVPIPGVPLLVGAKDAGADNADMETTSETESDSEPLLVGAKTKLDLPIDLNSVKLHPDAELAFRELGAEQHRLSLAQETLSATVRSFSTSIANMGHDQKAIGDNTILAFDRNKNHVEAAVAALQASNTAALNLVKNTFDPTVAGSSTEAIVNAITANKTDLEAKMTALDRSIKEAFDPAIPTSATATLLDAIKGPDAVLNKLDAITKGFEDATANVEKKLDEATDAFKTEIDGAKNLFKAEVDLTKLELVKEVANIETALRPVFDLNVIAANIREQIKKSIEDNTPEKWHNADEGLTSSDEEEDEKENKKAKKGKAREIEAKVDMTQINSMFEEMKDRQAEMITKMEALGSSIRDSAEDANAILEKSHQKSNDDKKKLMDGIMASTNTQTEIIQIFSDELEKLNAGQRALTSTRDKMELQLNALESSIHEISQKEDEEKIQLQTTQDIIKELDAHIGLDTAKTIELSEKIDAVKDDTKKLDGLEKSIDQHLTITKVRNDKLRTDLKLDIQAETGKLIGNDMLILTELRKNAKKEEEAQKKISDAIAQDVASKTEAYASIGRNIYNATGLLDRKADMIEKTFNATVANGINITREISDMRIQSEKVETTLADKMRETGIAIVDKMSEISRETIKQSAAQNLTEQTAEIKKVSAEIKSLNTKIDYNKGYELAANMAEMAKTMEEQQRAIEKLASEEQISEAIQNAADTYRDTVTDLGNRASLNASKLADTVRAEMNDAVTGLTNRFDNNTIVTGTLVTEPQLQRVLDQVSDNLDSRDAKVVEQVRQAVSGIYEAVGGTLTAHLTTINDIIKGFNEGTIPKLIQDLGLMISNNDTAKALADLEQKKTLVSLIEDLQKTKGGAAGKSDEELAAIKLSISNIEAVISDLAGDMGKMEKYLATLSERVPEQPYITPPRTTSPTPPPAKEKEKEKEIGDPIDVDVPAAAAAVAVTPGDAPMAVTIADVSGDQLISQANDLRQLSEAELAEARFDIETIKSHLENVVNVVTFAKAKVDAAMNFMIKAWFGAVWSDSLRAYMIRLFGSNWLADMWIVGHIIRDNSATSNIKGLENLIQHLSGLLELSNIKKTLESVDFLRRLVYFFDSTKTAQQIPSYEISPFCLDPCYPAIAGKAKWLTSPVTNPQTQEFSNTFYGPRWIFGEALLACKNNRRWNRPSSTTHRAYTAWALSTLLPLRDPVVLKRVTKITTASNINLQMGTDYALEEVFERPATLWFNELAIPFLDMSIIWGELVRKTETALLVKMHEYRSSARDLKGNALNDLLVSVKDTPINKEHFSVTSQQLVYLACFMANDTFRICTGKEFLSEDDILLLVPDADRQMFRDCLSDRNCFKNFASDSRRFYFDSAVAQNYPWVNVEPIATDFFWNWTKDSPSMIQKTTDDWVVQALAESGISYSPVREKNYDMPAAFATWSMNSIIRVAFNNLYKEKISGIITATGADGPDPVANVPTFESDEAEAFTEFFSANTNVFVGIITKP